MSLTGSLVGGAVLSDAGQSGAAMIASGFAAEAGEGLFALIDPFRISNCPWECVLEGVASALRPDAHAVALAFTYGDFDWPHDLSPAGQLLRVGRIQEGPFNLAAYATPIVREDVAYVLDEFGWRCQPAPVKGRA